MSHLRIIPLWLLVLALMPVAAAWQEDKNKQVGKPYMVIFLVAVSSLLAGAFVPLYTNDKPRSVNIVYSQDDSSSVNQWQIETFGPEDHAYLTAQGFPETPASYRRHGREFSNGYFIPAPDIGLTAPELNILTDEAVDETRILSGTISSPRSGYTLGVSFADAAPVISMSINDQLVLDGQEKEMTGIRLVRLHGLSDEEAEFEIVLRSNEPIEIQLYDLGRIPAVPGYEKLRSARPENAAPVHFGDYSIISKTYSF